MINARVKQYSRTLDDAKDPKMSADIIENRNKWFRVLARETGEN